MFFLSMTIIYSKKELLNRTIIIAAYFEWKIKIRAKNPFSKGFLALQLLFPLDTN